MGLRRFFSCRAAPAPTLSLLNDKAPTMTAETLKVSTGLLDVEYTTWNPTGTKTAILVHGWPDAPLTWIHVAPALAAAGYRVLAPALRGFAGTRFRSPETPRCGQLSALGQDLLDFMAALRLKKPVLVGHDWGARATSIAVGLQPECASHLVMLSVGYGTNDPKQTISYAQTKNYWYHWFMATQRGANAIENDREAFSRFMWDTWSPPDWYSEDDFKQTAQAFDNPDWAEIVLHSYRHRWGHAPSCPDYAAQEAALSPAPEILTPTLVIHGEADGANHPDTSKGKEGFFKSRYERVVLPGVGHFPQKEAPQAVGEHILRFIAS